VTASNNNYFNTANLDFMIMADTLRLPFYFCCRVGHKTIGDN